MAENQHCLSPETLGELIDGKLVDPELSVFSLHLEECRKCQARARTLLSSDTLAEILRGKASATEQVAAALPPHLIDSLKLIPVTDSVQKLSSDGLRHDQEISLDDLGLSFLEPALELDEIGRLGHYRILQVLGRGGMGAVFLADDPKLNRRVALKVMLSRIAKIPAARERFLREAKVAASLTNDHIVKIYQVDEINGVPFLAMELLQGESLEESIQGGRRSVSPRQFRLREILPEGWQMPTERAWSIVTLSPEISGWKVRRTPRSESRFWTLDWLGRKLMTFTLPNTAPSLVRPRLWLRNRLERIERSIPGQTCFRWVACCTFCVPGKFRSRPTPPLAL